MIGSFILVLDEVAGVEISRFCNDLSLNVWKAIVSNMLTKWIQGESHILHLGEL